MPPKKPQLNSGVIYLHDTGIPIDKVNESTLYGLTADITTIDEMSELKPSDIIPLGTKHTLNWKTGEIREYIDTDMSLTKRLAYEVSCNGNFEKGEVIKAMHNNDILVKVGNKYYRPTDVEYEMGLHEPPKLNIVATLAPFREVTTKELVDPFAIKEVIFNDPATIVLWDDGTKTVVKTQNGEEYDPEKGLAMAIAKKALGNNGNYFDVFKMFIKKNEERMAKEQKKEEKTRDELDDAIVQFLKCIFGNSVGHPERDVCKNGHRNVYYSSMRKE